MELTAVEQRVLGTLVEKQMTTPAHYPLTTNALVAGANQASNRDPVTDYGEDEVLAAISTLREAELVRSVKRPEDRVMKHRHDLDRTLALDDREVAVLAVLLLRGAQTPGELRSRTGRYTTFESTGDVEDALRRLAAKDEPLVRQRTRQPGQSQSRWVHLMGPVDEADHATSGVDGAEAADDLRTQVEALAEEVGRLASSLAEVRRDLGL